MKDNLSFYVENTIQDIANELNICNTNGKNDPFTQAMNWKLHLMNFDSCPGTSYDLR